MKISKLLLGLSMSIFFCTAPAFAHKEWVHQYIVQEAYKLLRDELGYDIPALKRYAGVDYNGSGSDFFGDNGYLPIWRNDYSMAIGAWREDNEDIIWNTGSWGLTHFWDADQGDNIENDIPPIFTFPKVANAFFKARCLSGSIQPKAITIKDACRVLVKGAKWYNGVVVYGLLDCTERRIFYQSIESLIREKKYSLSSVLTLPYYDYDKKKGVDELVFEMGVEINMTNSSTVRTQDNPDFWGYQLLGRIMHLLGDMSVPAHAHLDTHGCDWPVANGDHYELWMGGNEYGNCNEAHRTFQAQWWNRYRARSQGGLLWEVLSMNDYDAFKYLFANVNQLTGHYSAYDNDGDFQAAGNNLLNNNTFNPFLKSKLESSGKFYLGDASESYTMGYYTAEVVFNYVIRATATLMYRYALKLGLVPDCRQEIFVQSDRFWGGSNTKGATPIHFKASIDDLPVTAKIWAGKNVTPTKPPGDVVVDESASVTFESHDEIRLTDGFRVEKGAEFRAFIDKSKCNLKLATFTEPPDTTLPSGTVTATTDSTFVNVITGANVSISSNGTITIASGATVMLSESAEINVPEQLVTGRSQGDSVMIFSQYTTLKANSGAVVITTTLGTLSRTSATVTVSPEGTVVICTSCNYGKQGTRDEGETKRSLLIKQGGTYLGLAQPNPFSERTVIEYVLSSPCEVTLSVMDIFGRQVAELVRRSDHPAGRFTVECDASVLPAGVYFYTLRAGGYTETKKMILAK